MNPGRRIRLAADVSSQFAIFLIVLGAKLALISQYGRPHPYWDAWHVEGALLYKPFLTGTLRLSDLVEPVSEHRPLVLRAYDLCLFALNGQWDVRLQMIVNAVLFALLGCLLFWLLARPVGALGRLAIAAALTALFVVPSGWQNTLNGHHAGWFFFYLFSVAGMWLTLRRPPLSPTWFVGVGCIVLGYLSLFAGVITAAVAAGALALQVFCQRAASRRGWLAIGLLGLTFVVGMAIEPRFPGQVTVQASSLDAFAKAFGYALAWPRLEDRAYGVILHAPAVILLVLLVLRKIRYSPSLGFIVALEGWVWLQAIGIAYARGLNGVPPVPRYWDMLTFGLLAALASAVVLVKHSPPGILRRLPALALLVAWVLAAAVGIDRRTREAYTWVLPEKLSASVTQEFNLRSFVATGNRAYLDGKSDSDIAYYGGANQVAALLTDPVIRPILPASIREPLRVRWLGVPTDLLAQVPSPLRVGGGADPDAFGTYGPAGSGDLQRLESDWIPPPRLPFLHFRVAGDVGETGISITLVTESGRQVPLRPKDIPGVRWATVQVRAPAERFRIVADDRSRAGWLAFSAPREMGSLSYYAERLAEHATILGWAGYGWGIVFVGATAAMLVRLGELNPEVDA